MRNAQSITSALSHSKQRTSRNLQRTQQQLRRDCNLQQRGIETPEERRRRLERLKAEQGIGNTGECLSVLDALHLEDEQVRGRYS